MSAISSRSAFPIPSRLILGRIAGKLLPPLVSPAITSRLYSFERACIEGKNVTVRSVTGVRVAWPIHDIHAYQFILNGYYDWRLLAISQALAAPGDLIVEVGANIGTETVGFASSVGSRGKVLAFEPFAKNLEVLRRIAREARLPQIQVMPLAVGATEGKLPFVPPQNERLSGVGHIGSDPDHQGAISVRVTTLDHALGVSSRPVLIAIDVEGAELSVLRGGRKTLERARPAVVIEACARHMIRSGSSLSELYSEFSNLGYVVRAIRRFGLRQVDTQSSAEPCNWLALPTERAELLPAISSRILRCGLMPPWAKLNPLVRRLSRDTL